MLRVSKLGLKIFSVRNIHGRSRIVCAWIPGHSGIRGNEKTDQLANDAIVSGDLAHFQNYAHDLALLPRSYLWNSWNEIWAISSQQKGRRDIVGHGCNGMLVYKDDAHFPYPAIRFRETDSALQALREKEKGDWRYLSLLEKKALYRASFCQTYAEFQHPTGQWMFIVGWGLFLASFTFWVQMFSRAFVNEPLPKSLSLKSRLAQLDRIIELHTNPIDGLGAKWDYLENRWY